MGDHGRVSRQSAYYSLGYWRQEDLWTTFARVAERQPDHVALMADDRPITYRELALASRRLGAGLRARGVRQGDAVALQARNSIESVVGLLGCLWLGAVVIPVPPIFSVNQLTTIIQHAHPRVAMALADPHEARRVLEAARSTGSTELLVVADELSGEPDTVAWSELFRDDHRDRVPVSPDVPIFVAFSSGSTGTPKGVMHSANTLRYTGETVGRLHQVTPADTCLVVCEYGFIGSTVFGALLGLLAGATTVLMRRWDPDQALALIEKHRVTYSLMMPTHTYDILESPRLAHTDVSSFWRANLPGLTRERRVEAIARFCPKPLQMYGLSECLGNTTNAVTDDLEKILATDGRPLPGTEMRIVEEDGKVLPPGQVGAVELRGPSLFLGYHGNERLTAEAMTADGFYRTGDRGWLDPEGYMTYGGRSKDIIRRGTVTIIPGDVEAVLLTHPRIKDVALVGLPDERLGERACACVITKDGRPITLEEITSFLQGQSMARYQWPEHVIAMAEFPRTPSLKVKKPELVQQILAAGLHG